jgi:histidine ammonia-lyase
VSDNTLFFADEGEVLFGGNLHGQSTAFSLDFLAIAMAELSSISERRTYQLLSGRRGLPDFLAREPGRNSGLMIVQYTSAALVNENKVLSNPASVDTIPTCQLQEDSVSMGGTSAYKLMQVMDNLEYVLGIELLTAAQAVPFVEPLRLSPSTQTVFDAFRKEVAFLEDDRVLAGDIEKARSFVVHQAPIWRRQLGLA